MPAGEVEQAVVALGSGSAIQDIWLAVLPVPGPLPRLLEIGTLRDNEDSGQSGGS